MRFKDSKNEVKFNWTRQRVFEEPICDVLFGLCQQAKLARIESVLKRPRSKYRPQPLNTVEAQKLISRKLRISPEQAMQIMEKLYNKGFLSYPRTETTKFNPTINLRSIINSLQTNSDFGEFARRVGSGEMWSGPRNGRLDDKAHPPIHPVKNANRDQLTSEEWRIYDLLARHFLATISKDAIGAETQIKAEMGGEYFTCTGIIVEQMNWLEVFTFEKWSDCVLPTFTEGQQFEPMLQMPKSNTEAPKHLTESDLIDKMDKNGIGTDATIHEHIKNVQERDYCKKRGISLVPTPFGTSLVEVYQKLGIPLYKPFLRAQMEADMKAIAEGRSSQQETLKECVSEMQKIFL